MAIIDSVYFTKRLGGYVHVERFDNNQVSEVSQKFMGNLRATLPKIPISNFLPEIDLAHNSSINFTWQVVNKYEIISGKLNFFQTSGSKLLAFWNVLQT